MKKYKLFNPNPITPAFSEPIDKLKDIVNDPIKLDKFKKICENYPEVNPSILPPANRIIAIGDVHGDYKLVIKLLLMANVINIDQNNKINWIGGDTVVVQTGDQVDRCRISAYNKWPIECGDPNYLGIDEASDIKILKLFTDLNILAKKDGGRVIPLLGNHEINNVLGDMHHVSYENVKMFENYKKDDSQYKYLNAMDKRKLAFTPGQEYGNYLGCTRLASVIVGDILFVHGGYIDAIIDFFGIKERSDIEITNLALSYWLTNLIPTYENVIKKGVINKNINDFIHNKYFSPLLNRDLGILIDESKCNLYLSKILNILNISTIVVGHSIQTNGINGICNKKVWRIDAGMSDAFYDPKKPFLKKQKTLEVLEITNNQSNRFNVIKQNNIFKPSDKLLESAYIN